jgi:hypothetical protein
VSRIWHLRKRKLDQTVRDYARRSPVMDCLGCTDMGDEWRTMIGFTTRTLVKPPGGEVQRAGPVVIGIRYCQRFLGEAPHPFEIATVLFPSFVWHPNCNIHGCMCLGHPAPGISLDQILHQTWAGLTFHMSAVNTERYQVANPAAAAYVRDNATQFPITGKGLFEEPDAGWADSPWFAAADPAIEEQFRILSSGHNASGSSPPGGEPPATERRGA